jgi:hypothetical protein
MLKKQIGLCLLVVVGLLHASFVSAAVLSLVPDSINVTQSSSFDVDVVISDLDDDLVGAFDVTIGYDPSLLTATNVAFSGNLGFITLPSAGVPTPGKVNANETSLHPADELAAFQPYKMVQLATLSFMAINTGKASLNFVFPPIVVVPTIADELGDPISIRAFNGASVDISPIPLPGALWLMISALLGIGAMTRKRTQA